MMPNSQNGWPVDKSGANQDRNPIYGNVKVPNGVLKGDVATVLRYVAKRYHETVEPLVAGTCWGWFVKSIEGSKTISNHASGTAIDLNADQHPMGDSASKNMSAKQIAACRAIVRACDGVVRWGGDYSGRPDPMHWEVVGSRTATAALAKKIRNEQHQEEDDMAGEFTQRKAADGGLESTAGHVILTQAVTDGTQGKVAGKRPRVPAYVAIENLGALLTVLDAKISDLQKKVDALTPPAQP